MKNLDKVRILAQLVFPSNFPKIFSFHDCLPDVFSSYIDLLIYKRYRILGGRELSESLVSGKNFKGKSPRGKKEVVLTFDDGRRNCWSVIFPLLKKYKIKALIFIIPSRIAESDEYFPNLEDYWKGRVSWENLYVSHRKQPYLTWKELEMMQASGLVDIFSHSLKHEVVAVSSKIIDFQHPGVYEMPVYFDEWFQTKDPQVDSFWGTPIYERTWAPLASNIYMPNRKIDTLMNDFVKKNGGFLFFKRKDWRKRLFDFYSANRKSFFSGHFKKLGDKEDARSSVFESKKIIEDRLHGSCAFFSLPLYQGSPEILSMIKEAGYKAVFTGPQKLTSKALRGKRGHKEPFLLSRIPGFWVKFLNYF